MPALSLQDPSTSTASCVDDTSSMNESPLPTNIGNSMSDQEKEAFMHISGENRNKRSKKPRRPYSTTSSVYAEHTLSSPDNDQVIYCIGAILQAQIFDDLLNPDLNDECVPEFKLDIHLPPEFGGPVTDIPAQILSHESLHDLLLRSKLVDGQVPTVDTIYRFIKMLISCAKFSVECNILALVYINRMSTQHSFALSMSNWRGIWVAAIILAQKVWDDIPLKTSSFVNLLPNVTKEQLRKLEMQTFSMLDFNTTVKPSVYAKYYFELRQLFLEISGGDPRFFWGMQPMTMVQGRRLEHRSGLEGFTHSIPPPKITRNKSQNSQSSIGSNDNCSTTSTNADKLAVEQLTDSQLLNSAMSSGSRKYTGLNGEALGTPRTQEDLLPNRSRYVLS